MRKIVATVVLLIAASLGPSVSQAQDATLMALTELSVRQTIVDIIEVKAEKSAQEQQIIDAQRDRVVHKIMSSVCTRCFPRQKNSPARQAQYASVKPKLLVRLVGLDTPATQLER